jgi:hypothetical protein
MTNTYEIKFKKPSGAYWIGLAFSILIAIEASHKSLAAAAAFILIGCITWLASYITRSRWPYEICIKNSGNLVITKKMQAGWLKWEESIPVDKLDNAIVESSNSRFPASILFIQKIDGRRIVVALCDNLGVVPDKNLDQLRAAATLINKTLSTTKCQTKQ